MRPSTRRSRRPPPPPPPRGKPLLWVAVAGGVVLAAAAVAVILLLPKSSAPPPDAVTGEDKKETPAPPPRTESALDRYLAECERLFDEGNLKELNDKFWSPPAGLTFEENQRLSKAMKDFKDRAANFVETRTKEAEELAAKGRLQEAADRLRGLSGTQTSEAVSEAYRRLRRAVNAWLMEQRVSAGKETRQALSDLSTRYDRLTPPADPEAEWKRAARLLEEEKWKQAINALSALSKLDAWRERALLARARAHFAAEEYVGSLLDARILWESGKPVGPAVEWLNRAVTRASIDEAVRQFYEQVLEKDPAQPRVWDGLSRIWTWRHDVERAADVYRRAGDNRSKFDGPTLQRMTVFTQLRQRGFPAGKPVVVDYAGPYEILTDASPQRVRKLAKQLEAIAREYGAGFPYRRNPHFRFRVMFFSKDRDYQLYFKGVSGIKARERGALAYYSPAIKQLVVVDGGEEFHKIVRHEAFHQFLDYFVDDAPRWFNEGSASFFEMSTFGRAEFDPKYQRRLRMFLPLLPPLEKLLTMPTSEWVGDFREPAFYAQGWSFIYWLHQQGKGSLMEEYLRRLALGEPGDAAYARVFAGEIREFTPVWKKAATSGRYGARNP